MRTFNSNGKLLLTGEYLILDGAKSLALPTKKGQSLTIKSIDKPILFWESFDEKESCWLKVEFDLPKLRIISETFDSEIDGGNDSLALKLQEVLLEAKQLNPQFLTSTNGWHIQSKLDFQRNWGLGSSSTLINNIAQWAQINAYSLQFKTFGGSAYDIACAQNNTSIIYQLKNGSPIVNSVNFNPRFKEQLYFIHLNKKQNSRDSIQHYKNFKENKNIFIDEISNLTDEILNAKELTGFERILAQHEKIISSIIKKHPVQQVLFSDYFGQTKSLGAWGGDFILATGNDDTPTYFNSKGFHTILSYKEMIL